MLFQGFVWQPGAKFEYLETKRVVIFFFLSTGNIILVFMEMAAIRGSDFICY